MTKILCTALCLLVSAQVHANCVPCQGTSQATQTTQGTQAVQAVQATQAVQDTRPTPTNTIAYPCQSGPQKMVAACGPFDIKEPMTPATQNLPATQKMVAACGPFDIKEPMTPAPTASSYTPEVIPVQNVPSCSKPAFCNSSPVAAENVDTTTESKKEGEAEKKEESEDKKEKDSKKKEEKEKNSK